jgi:hypothetical protein
MVGVIQKSCQCFQLTQSTFSGLGNCIAMSLLEDGTYVWVKVACCNINTINIIYSETRFFYFLYFLKMNYCLYLILGNFDDAGMFL